LVIAYNNIILIAMVTIQWDDDRTVKTS